jgi:hypothetical protein
MWVITGHVSTKTENVKDIMIYNILMKWSHKKLLSELMLWVKQFQLALKRKKSTIQYSLKLS